jgi:hypothetical protein
VLRARGDKQAAGGNEKKLSNLRAEFTTFNGGNLITTPKTESDNTLLINLGLITCLFIGVEGN